MHKLCRRPLLSFTQTRYLTRKRKESLIMQQLIGERTSDIDTVLTLYNSSNDVAATKQIIENTSDDLKKFRLYTSFTRKSHPDDNMIRAMIPPSIRTKKVHFIVRAVMMFKVPLTKETFSELCRAAKDTGNIKAAGELVIVLKYCRIEAVDINALNDLISLNISKGKMLNALRVLHVMDYKGIFPPRSTYKLLFDGCKKYIELVPRLCNHMGLNGYTKLEQRNTTLRTYAELKLDRIFTVLDDMYENGPEPNGETFVTLFQNAWSLEVAEKLYLKILGTKIERYSEVQVEVIRMFSRLKKFSRAVAILSNLNMELSVEVLEELVVHCALSKDIITNRKVEGLVHDRKFLIGSPQLILLYLKCNYTDRALNEFQKMVTNGQKPDSETICRMLNGLAKDKNYADAETVLKHLPKVRNVNENNVLMKLYDRCDMFDTVVQVFTNMLEHGPKPDLVTAKLMVSACNRRPLDDTVRSIATKVMQYINASDFKENPNLIIEMENLKNKIN